MAAKFVVFVDEDHNKLPTLCWLSQLHKIPCTSRFVANYSSFTTTELSTILTFFRTAIQTC